METYPELLHFAIVLGALAWAVTLYLKEKHLSKSLRSEPLPGSPRSGPYLIVLNAMSNLRWKDWNILVVGFYNIVHLVGCTPVGVGLSALYLLQRGYEFADTHQNATTPISRIAASVHDAKHVIRGETYTFLIKKCVAEKYLFEVLILRNDAVYITSTLCIESEITAPYTLWMAIANDIALNEMTTKK